MLSLLTGEVFLGASSSEFSLLCNFDFDGLILNIVVFENVYVGVSAGIK